MKSLKSFKWRYFVLVASILGLIILSETINIVLSNTYSNNSSIINISGRQRMLTVRLAKQAYAVRDNLDNKIELINIKRTQDSLLKLYTESFQKLYGRDSKYVNNLIDDDIRRFLKKYEHLFATYTKLSNELLTAQTDKEKIDISQKLIEQHIEVLDFFEELTVMYQAKAEAKENFLFTINMLMGIVTIVTFIIELLLIFNPMFKRISTDIIDIEEKNRKISIQNEELENKNQELIKTNKQRDEFIQVLNHEIRTPLNTIVGSSRLLGMNDFDEENKVFIDLLLKASQRINNTYNTLLQYTTYKNWEEVKVSKSNVNFHFQIDKIISEYIDTISQKHLVINNNIDNNSVEVITQIDLLLIAIKNLIDNAVKFTNRGTIEINGSFVEEKTKFFQISIIDTGIGISNKELNKVFEEFEQISKGLTRNYEGIGLGLYISKKLVKLTRANLEITSELGKGTTVTIKIPTE